MENKTKEIITAGNFSYPQVRRQWFSVCIFPLRQLDGLKGNFPQSAPAGSLNVSGQFKCDCLICQQF